jgi:hypothetical protein
MAVRTITPVAWRETKLYYKVGSTFKGCFHCGSEDVFRSVQPGQVGWWHYCWSCSAKDQECWPTDQPAPYRSKAEEQRIRERAETLAAQQTLGNESPAYHLLTPREQMERRIIQNRALDVKIGLHPKRKRSSGPSLSGMMKEKLERLEALRAMLAARGIAV